MWLRLLRVSFLLLLRLRLLLRRIFAESGHFVACFTGRMWKKTTAITIRLLIVSHYSSGTSLIYLYLLITRTNQPQIRRHSHMDLLLIPLTDTHWLTLARSRACGSDTHSHKIGARNAHSTENVHNTHNNFAFLFQVALLCLRSE